MYHAIAGHSTTKKIQCQARLYVLYNCPVIAMAVPALFFVFSAVVFIIHAIYTVVFLCFTIYGDILAVSGGVLVFVLLVPGSCGLVEEY